MHRPTGLPAAIGTIDIGSYLISYNLASFAQLYLQFEQRSFCAKIVINYIVGFKVIDRWQLRSVGLGQGQGYVMLGLVLGLGLVVG